MAALPHCTDTFIAAARPDAAVETITGGKGKPAPYRVPANNVLHLWDAKRRSLYGVSIPGARNFRIGTASMRLQKNRRQKTGAGEADEHEGLHGEHDAELAEACNEQRAERRAVDKRDHQGVEQQRDDKAV